MDAFIHINEANFDQEVLKSEQPVLVEFGATWCQPCKMLEPVLARLGQEWAGKTRIAKVDVDECVNLTMQMQVMSVPTVILFVKGQSVARFSGYLSRERILEKLDRYLS